MSRQLRVKLLLSAVAVVSVVATSTIYPAPVPRHITGPAVPTLYLSATPREGSYGDPVDGARYEDNRRRIGIELSRRKENGPIRCTLRARPGAVARKESELEVELRNTSEKPVTVGIHRLLLDAVTFILRDPDDNVVSSFCYVTAHSSIDALPPVTLNPVDVHTSRIFLSVAARHGYQPLRPGIYSLEAVFHENSQIDPLGPDDGMLARSKRLAIRVE